MPRGGSTPAGAPRCSIFRWLGPAALLSVGGRDVVAAGAQALFLLDAAGRQYPGWGPKVLDFPLAG
ncbi:hypothetical protein, partial [Hymenobacter coccineus]|uniref:hypothetical protein n=1 Tax=Hymenobacter coccineus TaxID=1908235 RepID=UPI00114C957B